MAHPRPPEKVTIAPMAGAAEAQAFKDLNEAWITKLFTLEPADRAILDDPGGEIIAKKLSQNLSVGWRCGADVVADSGGLGRWRPGKGA